MKTWSIVKQDEQGNAVIDERGNFVKLGTKTEWGDCQRGGVRIKMKDGRSWEKTWDTDDDQNDDD